MAHPAKVFWAGGTDRFLVLSYNHMAGNTLFQTELFSANALVHGTVAFVQQLVHMAFAHDIGVIHTFITLAFGYLRHGGIRHGSE